MPCVGVAWSPLIAAIAVGGRQSRHERVGDAEVVDVALRPGDGVVRLQRVTVRHPLVERKLERVVLGATAVELQIQRAETGKGNAVRAAGGVGNRERTKQVRLRGRARPARTEREIRRRVDVPRCQQVVSVDGV